MDQSSRWKLNYEDVKKWVDNSLLFIAPLATIYLIFVAANINEGGLSWSDFVPNNFVLGTMVLYIVNVLLDFFKKLSKGPTV